MAEELKQLYRVVNDKYDKREEASKKNPENKQYLICIASIPDSGVEDEWCIVNGRRAAYEKIVESIDYIDLRYSFVLVETCTLSDRKSIYTFMKYMENFYNEGFDIDDYVKGDWSEQEYIENNEIDPIYIENNNQKVSLMDIMNGTIQTTSLGGDD